MSLQNFRTHSLAIEFYKDCKKHRELPAYARDQLCRAALSIPLNLAEGSTKRSFKDKIRYYEIAFASLREAQSLIEAEDLNDLKVKAHHLGGALYKLVNQPPPP